MKTRSPLVLVLVLVPAVATTARAANVLGEPSFESNTVQASDPFAPWTFSVPNSPTDNPDVLINDARATDGNNVLAMRGNASDGSTNTSLSQVFATILNQEYQFSFDYKLGAATLSTDIRVTITNDVLGDIFDESFNITTTATTSYSAPSTFLGDGGSYTLTIAETSANSSNRDPFLDNFVIDALQASVPAPAAMPAGLALLIALGARRRRRRA